ncbi:hypothetical protein EUGRSUZ_L00488 [Eucalyptus grandis]|uniref:Uncharacterized protein n=1 Tax=Eucalyptus grandis TaxID=71139 RepID=A0A058ZV99_EUCGR|nr:hypothetical protein EUGRSUZ_L00488 [Eucalyptus grandis]
MGDLGNTGAVPLRVFVFVHMIHAIISASVFSGHLFEMIAFFPFCISIIALPNQSLRGKCALPRVVGSDDSLSRQDQVTHFHGSSCD